MMRKHSWTLLFFLLLISADQLSKFVFSENSLCNKNIAWSIPIAPGFFYAIWILIFLFLVYLFALSKSALEKKALALVLSGAISNLTDRVLLGCVVDFIDIRVWPVFNLADIYITMGVIALVAIHIRNHKIRAFKGAKQQK